MVKRTVVAALLGGLVAFSAYTDECSFLPQRIESTAGIVPRLEDIAWNGGELAALTHVTSDRGTLLFGRYSREGVRLAPDVTVASGVLPGTARIAWSGSIYGTFFRGTDTKLRYRALSLSGDPLGSEVVPFPSRPYSHGEALDVAWDEDVFILAETSSPSPGAIVLSEIEPSGAVRSELSRYVAVRNTEHLDLVITPQARFVLFDTTGSAGEAATTQIVRSSRGASPELLPEQLEAVPASGAWTGEQLVVVGSLQVAEGGELRIASFDADGTRVGEETTLLESEGTLIPGPVLPDGDGVLVPYVSIMPEFSGELRILRIGSDFSILSNSRMLADATFKIENAPTQLVSTGGSVAAAIVRSTPAESLITSFCPLMASIEAPSVVPTRTSVTVTSLVTGGLQPVRYEWASDFGMIVKASTDAELRFPLARDYEVSLTVHDPLGQQYVATRMITAVTELPPLTVTIASIPTQPPVGTPVTFSATVEGGVSPYSYTWSVGEATSIGGSSLAMTFPASGEYPASVIVTDAAGQTATASMTVRVVSDRRRLVGRP